MMTIRLRVVLATFAFSLAAWLAASLTAPSTAAASGFASARFGGEKGTPTTSDPTAMYYNPAGLAWGRGTRIYVEGLFVHRSAEYDRPPGAIDNPGTGTPDEALGANSGHSELSNFIVSPFIGVSSDLGVENLGVALGFYTPMGGQAVWGENLAFEGNGEYPGAVDGPQRWFTIDGTIRSSYVTAAGAWRIPAAKLSFGVGLNLVMSTIHTVRARTASGTDDLVFPDGSISEGRSKVDVSSMDFSLGAGVLWQPMDGLSVGLSYQSQPGLGTMHLEGDLENKFGSAPVSTTPIDLEQDLPDQFRLGVSWRASDKVELRGWGDYTRWSLFEKMCLMDSRDANRNCDLAEDGSGGVGVIQNIPRDWKDAFGFRLSGSYWLKPNIELVAGAGYDGNAVPDETIDPALMDMDKVTASLGGIFNLMDEKLVVSATFTQVIYFERDVDLRARDAAGDAIAPLPPSRNPDGGGVYNQGISLLVIGLGYKF